MFTFSARCFGANFDDALSSGFGASVDDELPGSADVTGVTDEDLSDWVVPGAGISSAVSATTSFVDFGGRPLTGIAASGVDSLMAAGLALAQWWT